VICNTYSGSSVRMFSWHSVNGRIVRTVRTVLSSALVSDMSASVSVLDLLAFGSPGFPLSLRGSQAEHDNCFYTIFDNKHWCYFVQRLSSPRWRAEINRVVCIDDSRNMKGLTLTKTYFPVHGIRIIVGFIYTCRYF
jgi:hypothetical protein